MKTALQWDRKHDYSRQTDRQIKTALLQYYSGIESQTDEIEETDSITVDSKIEKQTQRRNKLKVSHV